MKTKKRNRLNKCAPFSDRLYNSYRLFRSGDPFSILQPVPWKWHLSNSTPWSLPVRTDSGVAGTFQALLLEVNSFNLSKSASERWEVGHRYRGFSCRSTRTQTETVDVPSIHSLCLSSQLLIWLRESYFQHKLDFQKRQRGSGIWQQDRVFFF